MYSIDTVVGVAMLTAAVGIWIGRIIGIRKEKARVARWARGFNTYRSLRDHVDLQGGEQPRTDGAHWRL